MATYYVATTGDDGTGDGSSGNEWLTISYAITQLSASDTLIVRDGTYSESIDVDVNSVTVQAENNLQATIQGTWSDTDVFPHTTGTWAQRYTGQVVISGTNVEFHGFNVTLSKGRGIVVTGDGWNVHDCYVSEIFNTGVQSNQCDNGLFEDITVYHASLQRKWKNQTVNGVEVTDHPNVFALVQSDNSTIRGCTATHSGGEGFSAFRSNGGCVIENCVSGNNSALQFYVNCAGNGYIMRNNIAYLSDPSSDWIPAADSPDGIVLRDEAASISAGFSRSSNVEIYGNLIINCTTNLWITKSAGLAGGMIANNTIIDGPHTTYSVKVENKDTGSTWSAIAKNNIIVSTLTSAPSHAGIDWDYNNWSALPDVDLRGPNDIVSDPLLVSSAGNLTSAPTATDYIKTASSPGVDAGITINGIATDYFGTAITAHDIGFDEYDDSGDAPAEPGDITLPGSISTDSFNGSSSSFSHTTTSDTNLLVLFVSGMRFQTGSVPWTVSSITFNGSALTAAVTNQNTTTNRNYTASIWYIATPDVGTYTVAVTLSTSVQRVRVVALNVAGASTGTPIGDTASVDGVDGSGYLTSDVTIDAGEGIFATGVVRGDNSGGWTVGTGSTELDDYSSGDDNTHADTSVWYRLETIAGTYTVESDPPNNTGATGAWIEVNVAGDVSVSPGDAQATGAADISTADLDSLTVSPGGAELTGAAAIGLIIEAGVITFTPGAARATANADILAVSGGNVTVSPGDAQATGAASIFVTLVALTLASRSVAFSLWVRDTSFNVEDRDISFTVRA